MKFFKEIKPLLQYPKEDFVEKVGAIYRKMRENYPAAAKELKVFYDYIQTRELDDLQELFTRTFEVQAICYLDLGYVIFGEDYKRGEFLVEIQREQAEAKNDCGSELPDHLSNMVTLLPKMTDEKMRNEIAVRIMIPAIDKIVKEFEAARLNRRMKMLKRKHNAIIREEFNKGNVYRNVLLAIRAMLVQDFNEEEFDEVNMQPENSASFLTGCSTCDVLHTPVTNKKTQSHD